jgi:hypothetical protein
MGRTAGEALDALAAQLPREDADTLVIVRNMGPDRFFGAAERGRSSTSCPPRMTVSTTSPTWRSPAVPATSTSRTPKFAAWPVIFPRGDVARLFSDRVDRVAKSRCAGSEPGGRPPDRDGRAGERMAARYGATSPDVMGHPWIPRRAMATPVTRGGPGEPGLIIVPHGPRAETTAIGAGDEGRPRPGAEVVHDASRRGAADPAGRAGPGSRCAWSTPPGHRGGPQAGASRRHLVERRPPGAGNREGPSYGMPSIAARRPGQALLWGRLRLLHSHPTAEACGSWPSSGLTATFSRRTGRRRRSGARRSRPRRAPRNSATPKRASEGSS